jgi:hypothetical protein
MGKCVKNKKKTKKNKISIEHIKISINQYSYMYIYMVNWGKASPNFCKAFDLLGRPFSIYLR